MRVNIDGEGILSFVPESSTELFAIREWLRHRDERKYVMTIEPIGGFRRDKQDSQR